MQTETKLCNLINDLVEYAIDNELAEECDRVFLCNRICREFGILDFFLIKTERKTRSWRSFSHLFAI